MKINVLLDLKNNLGEGPVWDTQQQRLYWIDSLDGRVFSCTERGTEIKADVRQKIGSMALCKDGNSAIVALEKEFIFLILQRVKQALYTHLKVINLIIDLMMGK